MSLRRQLLIASLLLLTLPWAGCQFAREMEGALRQGQEQALQATALAVAATLKDKPELLYPYPQRLMEQATSNTGGNRSLYAFPMQAAVIIDGYGDDWDELEAQTFKGASGSLNVKYKAATRRGRLFLFLKIEDGQVVFHNPALSAEPNGDRLVLRTWLDGKRQEYIIATAAPGKVVAKYGNRIYTPGSARRIRGQWQDTAAGYNLELEIPLDMTGGRLGFFIVNAGKKAGERTETLGNTTPLDMAPPPWIIFSPAALGQTIAPFKHPDRQLLVVDKTHWLLANAASDPAAMITESTAGAQANQTFWLLRILYRSILDRGADRATAPPIQSGKIAGSEIETAIAGATQSLWYQNPEDNTRSLLSAAAPIHNGSLVIGAVVIRQSSEEYLSLTDQAFSRLLSYSLLALAVGIAGLLAFASILSWRIGKLSRAASNIIQEDGSLGHDFPVSRIRDEIGELSRNYGDMLNKLREYNNYLRTLSHKLSHELRTPIAVIQTSLENLKAQADTGEASHVYITRAEQGLGRLNNILTAMSEANRLEESIHKNTPRELDLVPLLQEVFTAYQGLYPQHRLKLVCTLEQAPVLAVPELIVQALDKLMDNAASFTAQQGRIVLGLRQVETQLELSVSNEGPLLPEALQSGLFDSMVSLREGSSENVHLGLGLYIVRLIAECHKGSVKAQNLESGNGVKFTITLPMREAPPPS